MWKFVFGAMLLVGSISLARPSSFEMSCAQTVALVKSKRSVAMNYAYSQRAGWLYNLYVAHPNYCGGHAATRASVPTIDVENCWVGYVCQSGRD